MDSTVEPTKWCNVCEQDLPIAAFYPRPDRLGQYLSTCRPCRAKRAHEGHLAKKSARTPKPPIPDEKECTGCHETKPLEDFAPRKTARDGRTSHCRTCRNEQSRRYKEENHETVLAHQRMYYRENTEACKDRIRASNAKKPDKYRAIHSEWKRQHKDAVNASTHKRRARMKSVGEWSQADWQRLKAQYDWRCLMCGRQEMTDGITLCFDHVVPLDLLGWNIISNGQPLCRSCNSKKHRRVMDLR